MSRPTRLVAVVILLPIAAYTTSVIIHALLTPHSGTNVFWLAIAMLGVVDFVVLGLLHRVARRRS